MPKVSVCIPTYNCGRYIKGAINSVLMQEFEDYELIISDNASNDDTENIVKSFTDRRISYIRNLENIGYTRNVYNLIHHLANGEYIIILCADDFWIGEILKEAIELFENHNELSFIFSALIMRDEFLCRDIPINNQFSKKIIDGKEFFKLHLMAKIRGVVPSNVIFRKKDALEVNAFADFSLRYAPDWELRLKLSLLGKVGYIKRPLTIYRWHRDNLSTLPEACLDRFTDDIRCIENVIDFIKNRRIDININNLSKLRQKSIRKLCLRRLGGLVSLKSLGIKNSNLFLVLKKIYKTDKYTFLNLYALKALLILFPIGLLRFLRKLKYKFQSMSQTWLK